MTSTNTPIVQTIEGPLQGIVENVLGNDTFVFKGIPYAKPPVKELRWRRPEAVEPWADVLQANAYGNASWQDRDKCIAEGGGDPGTLSEDCLYLNVWTAPFESGAPPSGLPVMFWIHGGAYIIGAGGLPPYIGAPQVARGAVVVTINYRLGRLGFFAHPALETEHQTEHPDVPSPMNFGLLDQIAALQWVNRNIANFGGDPGNVTIIGQSAGGKSVLALFASPLATGLFHKGIAQSVYRIPEPTRDLALLRGVKLAYAIGLDGPEATAEQLRAVPPETFMELDANPTRAKGTSNAPNPIVGDEVLPDPIIKRFKDGTEKQLPLILGNTSDDASVVTDFGINPAQFIAALDDKNINVRPFYPDIEKGDDTELGRQLLRDVVFTLLTRQLADEHAKRPSMWRYYFDYTAEGLRAGDPTATPPRPPVVNGTRHGDDIVYVLNTGDLCPPTEGIFTDNDREIARRVSEYWFEFARTGTPASNGGPAWEEHKYRGLLQPGPDRTLIVSDKKISVEMTPITVETDFMKRRLDNFLSILFLPFIDLGLQKPFDDELAAGPFVPLPGPTAP